jgi:adenosine deaminase
MSGQGLSELHRHLDGSIRPATVEVLARESGLTVPEDLCFHVGMGLAEALAKFAFTVSLLQGPRALCRVAEEMCRDAESEGITSLEVRFAPQLHGIGIEAAVDAVLQGIDGRAGLLLCGLYGDHPDILESLVDAAASRPGVVGLDLAGGPAPAQRWQMLDYERPFRRAADIGLGRTVHAGEGRPALEIAVAIERLGAQRIGHGTTLLDDPRVTDLVLDYDVTIEASPTSNVHTGVIASVADHPLAEWLRRGVRVCVCTDNTLLSDVDMPQELERVRGIAGIGEDELSRLVNHGHAGAFQRS